MTNYISLQTLRETGTLTNRGDGFYYHKDKRTGEIRLMQRRNEQQFIDYERENARKYLSPKSN